MTTVECGAELLSSAFDLEFLLGYKIRSGWSGSEATARPLMIKIKGGGQECPPAQAGACRNIRHGSICGLLPGTPARNGAVGAAACFLFF
jgi:hypothetical protein